MKKKILFVNGHMNVGGVEKALLDILKHIDYEKYEVDLLLFEEIGDYSSEIPSQVNIVLISLVNTYGAFFECIKRNVQLHDWFSLQMRLVFLLMKIGGQSNLKYAKKLILDGKKYDCAIAFRRGICSQVVAYAVAANKKVTWWHHGEYIDIDCYPEVLKEFDTVIAVSRFVSDMLKKEIPQENKKIVCIPNIVDVGQIKKKAEEFLPHYCTECLNIVSVARFASEKHLENIIFVAEKMKKAGIRFVWHFVGDGELRIELTQLALEKKVQDVVIFEGNQSNPYPFIKSADIFVHPSYVESFGLVIFEAMSLSVPTVVVRSGGPENYLEDGMNAILVDKGIDSLYNGIMRLILDSELYTRVKNAQCPIEFLPSSVMVRIEELIG